MMVARNNNGKRRHLLNAVQYREWNGTEFSRFYLWGGICRYVCSETDNLPLGFRSQAIIHIILSS